MAEVTFYKKKQMCCMFFRVDGRSLFVFYILVDLEWGGEVQLGNIGGVGEEEVLGISSVGRCCGRRVGLVSSNIRCC